MANRKKIYFKWVNSSLNNLKKYQDFGNSKTKGCFFYPYYKKKVNYCNARWQEAVLTFAWHYNKTKNIKSKERAKAGIDFWCKIQHRKGFFTEYAKYDQSFSATAFSVLAVLLSIKYIGIKKEWKNYIEKAARWLVKNDEKILINQESVAAVALLVYSNLYDKSFKKYAESKLRKVLKSQKNGYYKEDFGYDFSYSTLTLEMLGLYYLNTQNKNLKNKILESAKKFIETARKGKYDHIRKTDWAILDGFEIFASQIKGTEEAMKKIIKKLDVYHLKDERHICTDSYRFCLAYDHCSQFQNTDLGLSKIKAKRPGKYKKK
jgi:hypothetical protein